EGPELGDASLLRVRPRLQLLVPASRGCEVAPSAARLRAAAQLLVADEPVEDAELVRAAREPALLELSGHREPPLTDGGEVLPRAATPPRVRARAAVGEDAAGEHEPFLVLRAQLGERRQVVVVQQGRRQVELGLDVCLAADGTNEGHVALGAEQQADRL